MDQLLNQLAKMKYMFGGKARLPVTVMTSAGAGTNMAAQHSQSLEAMLCHVPGLKVVMPSNAHDAKGLLIASIRDDDPVIFIMHKFLLGSTGEVPEDPYEVPIGVAKVVRPGTDVTVVAYGTMVGHALAAADELDAEGISLEIVDPRTLHPLDVETIVNSVKKTNRIVSVEEGWPFAGIGSEIAAIMMEECFDWLDAPVKRVAGKDVPLPYAANLERLAVPQVEDIVAAARDVAYR
jgi:pyruvate dehydrogenase E1 component beta subunit